MHWCLAEFPEHSIPGVWVAVDEPSVIQYSDDREDWKRAAGIRFPGTVGFVDAWPVVSLESGRLRSGADALLWVAGEVVGFDRAELVGESTYILDGLRRGLRGTLPIDHPSGAEVMLLDEQAAFLPVSRPLMGRELWWRAVPDGESGGLARPHTVQGLVCPRLDGSRPTVRGSAKTPPSAPRWGDRWLVCGAGAADWYGWGGDVAVWLDGWYRESPEIGTQLLDLETRSRLIRMPEGWVLTCRA